MPRASLGVGVLRSCRRMMEAGSLTEVEQCLSIVLVGRCCITTRARAAACGRLETGATTGRVESNAHRRHSTTEAGLESVFLFRCTWPTYLLCNLTARPQHRRARPLKFLVPPIEV